MIKERIALEIVGYVKTIFGMGVLSKGIQFVEGRRDRVRKAAEEKARREWQVTEEDVKLPDGTIESNVVIFKMATEEELQRWKEYSDSYYAEKEGFYIARLESNGPEVNTKDKAKEVATDIGKKAVRITSSVFIEGAKRRAAYELKDTSRAYAKSAKETEMFLKNNIKNKMR